MSRLPGISDLFRSRSQVRRRKPKRRREAERFAGRMESLESRALLAFSPLPASGSLGGAPLAIFSDAAGPNELTIILDDTTNPGSITATITTNDAVPQTRQFSNFSAISYLASNDTDGLVVNTVNLWTSYEADLAGFENAPADDSEVGLATLWQVESHFPTGAATTSLLTMQNVDRLVVTSGVIGGNASTIAGEFESPTLGDDLDATTGANITLISGTGVTGTDLGGTADLEPIVAYTLTLKSQTAGVTLDTDVFTAGDLTINAAGTITLNGLLQSTSGDIEAESTSGQIRLDGAELHALDGGITLRTLKEGIVQVPATAPNPRWQDYIVAETDVTIEAGGEVVLIGGVRANTGDIELSSKDRGVQFTGEDAVLHAVVGSVEINATRGPATLQNLFANKSITVNALGDVSLNGTFQTTSGDLVVNSEGNIGNSARLLVGGSLKLDGGLNVSSLGGGIVRLELLSGGTNYEYAIVTIAPPAAGGGRAALARAAITGGVITGLTIVDPGYGYAPSEQVAVAIEGNPESKAGPAASGARATAFAGSTLSSMQAGQDLTITAGTAVDISNELRAENGKVTVAVSAGPLSLSDIFAGEDISLTAAQTIDLGGLVRTAKGDVSVESTGGGVGLSATLLAPAGGANVTAAAQIVQRGGSVSRDRLFLLSGGRDYTYALVVVDPPPGAGQAALARAVITYVNPGNPSQGGYISDIILLDPGWGYPSNSRVNVSIQGDGEGAEVVFATDIVTSSIDVRDDVTLQAGDSITLVSSVRSSAGSVTLRNSIGDLAVQSVTSALAADVESERGKVTLVSVAAGGKVDIAAFRGVSVTDSVNTTAGDIAITTVDGDLQFVQGFDFGDNYLVNADATALQPLAVIATAAGGIALRSDNGSITTPFVLNATDDINVTSFGPLEAANEITSTKGDVVLRSTSGLVQLKANVATVGGSITISAHTQLKQQVTSGVSKIQLLSPGDVVTGTAPNVTVTVAAPRNGGTAATAVAIIERRSTGAGPVIQDEYFLGAISIIDPGQGYAVGEQPSVTITGISGAAARAFGPLNAAMLTAGDGITLSAGEDITLVTKVHSTTGSVVVQSAAGNIDLSDRSLLLSAAAGAISVDAPRGTVVVQRAAAAEDVTIVGLGGITVLGSVVSEDAGITLKALDGAVDARQVNAADDVTITAFKSGKLAGEIASSAGAVSFTSLAGGLFLEANIVAAGAVDIDAQTFILQDGRSGVERIDVIDGGSATGAVAPTVTVTVAAPVAGGTAARAQAVIGQRSATEYFIESIYIIDPGTGYALGEVAEVTITGMAGASARAFGPTNLRNVTGGTGVTLEAGDDITLVNTVTATTGDVVVTSKTGQLQLDANGFLGRAAEGSVLLTGSAGSVFVQRASASEDVTLFGAKGVVVLGSVDAGNDASVVTGGDGRVSVTRIVAGDSVTVTAGDDVELLDLVDAATGGVLVTSTAGNLATRRIYSELDITLKTADQVYLLGVLESAAGDIAIESVAGSVELDSANLLASSGAITITAHGVVNQPTSTGVVAVRELDPGQFVGATAPTVDVTIAAPAGGGGTAATARAIVRRIGFVPVNGEIFIDPSGNVVVVPPGATPVWGVVGLTVTNPGSGYAPNERPAVAFTGIPNAVYEAFAPGSFPTNIVAAEDVRITGGGNVLLSSVVQSNAGDVDIASVSGNLDLSADTFLAHAVAGGVTLTSSAGTVAVQQVTADDAVSISGARGVEIEGLVDSVTGSVAVTSTAGGLLTNDIYAELDITLSIAEQVTLLGVLESDAGDIEVTSLKRDLDLTAAGARIAVDAGSATLTAINGTVLTPPVLQANGDVTIRGLTTIGLRNEVTSATGTITVESVSGGIELTGNLNAVAGAIDLVAHGAVTQSVGGVSYVEVLTGGTGYGASATVTIASPAAGGRAATGRLVLGTVGGASGVIIGITVVDPGLGYAAGELPTVTIAGAGTGATARAVVVSGPQNIVAGTGITVAAGTDVLLVNTVTANKGDVAIDSTSGDIVTGRINSVAGGVTLAADLGVVTGTAIRAASDIAVTAESVVIDTVVSSAGGVDVEGATQFTLVQGKGDVNVAGDFVATTVRSTSGNVTVLGARSLSSVFAGQVADVSGVSIGSVEAGTDAIVRGTAAVGAVTAGQDATVTAPTVSNVSAGRDARVSGADVRNVEAVRDVGIRNTGGLTVSGLVRSETGDVSLLSAAGAVTMWASVVAESGMVTVEAQTGVSQVESTGLTSIDVVLAGSVTSATAPVVTVTVAAPAAAGGRAATAEAILQTSLDANGDTVYSLERLVLIDRGAGYAAGETPAVTITGLAGAAAVAAGPLAAQSLWAGDGILIAAGADVTLTRSVTATGGDIAIASTSGNLDLSADTFLAHAAAGSVTLTSSASTVAVERVNADLDVTITGNTGVTVQRQVNAGRDLTVTASAGSANVINLTAGDELRVTAGIGSAAEFAATVNTLHAGSEIEVAATGGVNVRNQLVSTGGDIRVTSVADSVELDAANLLASSGAITITAHGLVSQPTSTGVVAVGELSRGQFVGAVGGPAPTVTVTIAAPAGGGTPASASAIVQIIGFLPTSGSVVIPPSGTVVVVPPGAAPVWGVVGVTVTNPGSGYAANERPLVTFTGITNAVYEAFAAGSFPTNIVAAEDVRITGGGNVLLSSVVQSNEGNIAIASVSGNLDLSADTFLAHAVAGGVTLTSSAGTVAVQQVTADDAVSISGATGVAIEGLVNSATGSVTVDATAGEAMIRTILAGDSVTVGASHDVTLIGVIDSESGDVSITSRNRDLDFTAAGAQLNALQGGVSLAAVNGTIMSPPTLHASKNVTLTSFNTLALNNEITSDTGVIDLKSTSGSINLGANLDARDDSIRIHAKGSVTQIGGGIGFVRVLNGGSGYTAAATVAIAAPSGGGVAARGVPIIGRVNGVNGVITGIRITNPGSGYGAGEQPTVTFTRNAVPPPNAIDASVMAVASPALGNSGLAAIDVLDGGSGYTATTIVTIAAPVGGGTAATAQAVIGTVEVNGVMRDGVILDIVIVNPGSGYGAGEQPVVTITGAGTGAVARAIANIALQDIRGGKDIDIYAGTGVTLLNTIRADQGHVSITSETGNVNLAARTLLVSSFMDDIEITSRRGAVNVQRLAAGGDIAVKAQTGVTLLNAVNSTGDFGPSDVSIYTVNGNIAAVAPNGLISVQNGGVLLESVNGTILVPQVFNVTGDVSLKTFGNLTIDRPLTSSAGNVTLASATGAVNIAANVFADERVTLSAKTGISQTKGFLKGDELVARNSTTSAVSLTNPANDFANVSLMSLGAVSYVDANDFETGVERSPYSGMPLGVEVRGESLNLSSVGTNSRIRVVSGLSYKTLSIAAGTQGGNNVGYVEYVTTSTGDNPQANAAFRGTLRDMIRYTNDNTATYVNAGNTRVPQPQMMVFDETGYLVEEVAPAAALPAFSRPVWFDGGRLEETATANRLGISGNNSLLHGLSFAAATPAVTGVRPATPGSAGSRVESLAVYGFTKGSGVVLGSGNNTVVDMHAGLKADGTVSANMIGLDVRGAAAINNTIGEQVVDAETVNRFAGNTLAGIMIRSGAAGTQVFGSVIGDDTGANPALANGDGIQIVNATRSQIGSANAVDDDLYATRSNIIAGNLSAGVRISNAVAGTLAAANVVRNNVIRGNRTGVEISASAFAVLGGPDAGAANVITGQTLSGVVVTDSRSVQIQGNRIGIMAAYGDEPEAVAGNGVDGIAISGKSQGVEIGGGNWIGGNTAHGVRIGTGVTGVMMTSNRIGGELSDGSTAGNGQDGVAITAAIGNTIGSGNVIARNGRHGVSITDARAETLLAGNRVFGSTISGNQSNGVLLGGGSRTTIGGPTVADANLIQGNVGDGVRLVSTSVTGAATGHVIQRNYVGSNPAGDVNTELGNKGSGIALVGTSDVVVGDANVVMNNGVDGIAVNGGRGVTIGSAIAAVGNQIRSNARHGVSFNGAATGGRVMGNLIEGQGGDGVFVGNGARDVRIGHIVTQSAVTGAANVVRGNAGWGVRVMPGAQQIAVQGNSSFGNVQGALSRAAGANAAAPSSVTLTSAVMRTATGGTRQLAVTGTIAGARARQQYSVDVYASSVGESAQGRRHLGRFNVTATADGQLSFNSTITATVAVDEWISVAATTLVFDPGSTSQLSAPVRAVLRR